MDLEFGERCYRQQFQVVPSMFLLPIDGILKKDILKGRDRNSLRSKDSGTFLLRARTTRLMSSGAIA